MGSVCAGLGQALQHGWQEGFPLQASPFQVLARQTGASLRELLTQCQTLQRQGTLQGPRVQWGARVSAWRLRGHLQGPPEAEQAGLQRLVALPGTAWVEWCEGDIQGVVFELQARSSSALRQQQASLSTWAQQDAQVDLLWIGLPEPACRHCTCGEHGGPCTDPELARRLEGGLPLCAHPFQAVASELGRSEREVLAQLRRWQDAGDLHGLSLAPPHRAQQQAVASVLLQGPFAPDLPQRLAAHTGVVDVQPVADTADQPVLWVSLSALRDLALPQLDQMLAAEGLKAQVRQRWLGLRSAPRAQPLFFQAPVV
ncbi:hypothetical protein [Inhella gelatinilytica]|uniref:Siroheme decarboxylase NirL-like HTH domain-containing protein n=1 Tax=Inhella gelatinilytica TaxID=2795030 RepID=A0A931IY25_9BURK|nr:hypothetical protein [Inhella gelatinilytica]MBH9552113.1 hypothetical protein [Inhella gelatinilytica]